MSEAEESTNEHKVVLGSVDVSVEIVGLTSEVTLSQRFLNVGDESAEIRYDLRLFSGDTLLRLEARRGEELLIAEASTPPEDQVDPSEAPDSAPDLDWINDAFDSISPDSPSAPSEDESKGPKAQEYTLGPLAPGEGLSLQCTYQTTIAKEGPRRVLQIPLASLPGCLTATKGGAKSKAQVESTALTLSAALPSSSWPKALTSTSHPITTTRSDEQHLVHLEQTELPALQNFHLRWEVAERATKAAEETSPPAAEAEPKASSSLLLANRSSKVEGLIEDQLLSHLGSQHNVPAIDIVAFSPEEETLALLSRELCAKHKLLPVSRAGNTLVLAMADPSNIMAIDEVKFITGLNIEVVVATELSFITAFEKFYPALEEEAKDTPAAATKPPISDSQLRVPTNLSSPSSRAASRSAAAHKAAKESAPAIKAAPAIAKARSSSQSLQSMSTAENQRTPGFSSLPTSSPSLSQVPGTPDDQETKALLRKGVIRYYELMNPGKSFPLLVSLLQADLSIARPDMPHVQQTKSDTTLALQKDSPYVRIVPVLPGCQVSPPEMILNATNPKVDAGFWITPTYTGDLTPSAVVQVWHENELKDEIPIPTKVRAHTWTKILAVGSACMTGFTIFTSLNDWRHIPTKASKALPSATELLSQKLASTALKWFALVDTAGIVFVLLLLTLTALCYFNFRPRMADPLERFLQSEIEVK